MKQSIYKDGKKGFLYHTLRSVSKLNYYKRFALEQWFYETERFILKEIPELEEFVEKYANR